MDTQEKSSNLSWGLYIEDLGSRTGNTNKTWRSNLSEDINVKGFLRMTVVAASSRFLAEQSAEVSVSQTLCLRLVIISFLPVSQLPSHHPTAQSLSSCHTELPEGLRLHHGRPSGPRAGWVPACLSIASPGPFSPATLQAHQSPLPSQNTKFIPRLRLDNSSSLCLTRSSPELPTTAFQISV